MAALWEAQQAADLRQSRYLNPTTGLKSGIPCGWIKERLEEVEEEGDPIGRPAVSTNLDPRDLSDTEPPTRQHTLAGLRPQTHTYMYRGGLPGLDSMGEDAPNPRETWGPREWGGLGGGISTWRQSGGGMEWGNVKGRTQDAGNVWIVKTKTKTKNQKQTNKQTNKE